MPRTGEVREMRNAETILGIIRERGRRGLPLEDVYRQLFNPELYLLAYGKIARNAGAMTPGATAETADGMALAKIERIIGLLRQERYRWTPVRRVYIPKNEREDAAARHPDLVGQAAAGGDPASSWRRTTSRSSATAPTASDRAAAATPRCTEIHRTWTGHGLVHRGGHHGMLRQPRPRRSCWPSCARDIHDNRFLRLIANLLRAGYLEDWTYHRDPERDAARRAWSARSSPTSTWTGWTSSSRPSSSRRTPAGPSGRSTRRTNA